MARRAQHLLREVAGLFSIMNRAAAHPEYSAIIGSAAVAAASDRNDASRGDASAVVDRRPLRLLSLDVFRGMTVASMLLANHQGDSRHAFAQLQHAEWHGWTATDLIFPFFLFIVGVSLVLSSVVRLARGASRREVLGRAVTRGGMLFVLGLLLATFPWWRLDPSVMRIPGVLQRIALCVVIATPAVLWLGARGQAVLLTALLLLYWVLLTQVPAPGAVAGVLQPGLDLGAYIDRAVFGTAHLWPGDWDPEGLLSTMPAVASVLSGALTARWLLGNKLPTRKAIGMVAAGLVAIVAGLTWGRWFPINKNLWTSSYTVFTSGAALLLFGTIYWLADVRRSRWWTWPFVAFGANAILVYVLAQLTDGMLRRMTVAGIRIRSGAYDALFASWLSTPSASLAFAATYMLFWWGVLAVLDRHNVRLRV